MGEIAEIDRGLGAGAVAGHVQVDLGLVHDVEEPALLDLVQRRRPPVPVNVAAETAATAEAGIPRSSLQRFLTPLATPAARKPRG